MAYEDTPAVNEDEKKEVKMMLHGEDIDEKVVWYRLGPSVDGVEGMRGKRSWHYNRTLTTLVRQYSD